MRKYFILKFLVLLYAVIANAQSTIDTVLSNVLKNNKTILANTQYWEAQKLQYKTGLTPYNPMVNYDYLIGSPNTAGNQTDFTLTQTFDFPSVYIKKKQLSEQQIAETDFQLTAKRQDILLETKKTCIELVYRNKLQFQLSERKLNIEKLVSDFQTKLHKGDGNILDVNKARLQLIEINKEFQQNLSLINQLKQKLTEHNGGFAIIFMDTVYPLLPNIPTFEQLENEIEANDPIRKILEQEKRIAQTQVQLSKSLSFPKLETGYHYQGILGQKFSGIHTGITIPLWENKNKVKQKKAELFFSDLKLQAHRNEHYFEIKQFYEKYQNLKITLAEYQTLFSTINNTTLLNKALAMGQISTIEYFIEMTYYYHAFTNYLLIEKEFHDATADLYKFQL